MGACDGVKNSFLTCIYPLWVRGSNH